MSMRYLDYRPTGVQDAWWVRSRRGEDNPNGMGEWRHWKVQDSRPYDEPYFDKQAVRLIPAAVVGELVEALRNAEAALSEVSPSPERRGVLRQIRTAIARAEGGAQ